jgi:hypothetical protein
MGNGRSRHLSIKENGLAIGHGFTGQESQYGQHGHAAMSDLMKKKKLE